MKKLLLLVIPTLFSGAVMAKTGESTLSFGYLNVKSGGENECAEMIDRVYQGWTYCKAGGYRFQGNKITIQQGRNLEWVFVDTSAIDDITYSTPSYVIDFDLYF